MTRRHPHPDRLAETYRWHGEKLIFVGYTADPPPGGTWDEAIMGWILDDEPEAQLGGFR